MKHGGIGLPTQAFPSSGAPLAPCPGATSNQVNPNEAMTPPSIPAWDGGEAGRQAGGEEGKGKGGKSGGKGGRWERKKGRRTKEYVKWKAKRGQNEREARDYGEERHSEASRLIVVAAGCPSFG